MRRARRSVMPLFLLFAASCRDQPTGPRNSASTAWSSSRTIVGPTITRSGARFPVDLAAVSDPVISQTYAEFDDQLASAYHTGFDIPWNKLGLQPTVYPALTGVIVLVQQNGKTGCAKGTKNPCNDHGYGNTIII